MDLTALFQNHSTSIPVQEVVCFEKEEIKGTDIEKLENVSVTGQITKNDVDMITCDLEVAGTMFLKDAISNEVVPYPFSFSIEENIEDFIEKSKNSLAFKELLWENIVLEIPIRYTTVEDYQLYQGNGWRLTSEDATFQGENPFQELLNHKEEE